MAFEDKKQEKQINKILLLLQKAGSEEAVCILKEKGLLPLFLKLEPRELRKRIEKKSVIIPVSLFSCAPLSSLEAMTVYLKEKKNLRFCEIAHILGRNQVAINTTYRAAKKKYPLPIAPIPSEYCIPCFIFSKRSLSVLENIVSYLKTEYQLPNHEIARLLNKDPRTIWTVLQRIEIKKKNETNKK